MAIDLSTIPNPLFDENVRSARELVRRMLLLRWTTGQYLDSVTGNYGLSRPPLGFYNEDVFRASAQALMADYKAIGYSYFQILEILLGPYEDLYYELIEDKEAGSSYISIKPFGDYVEFDSLVGVFIVNERITALHPKTGDVVEAQFKYLDPIKSRLYFTESYSIPDGLSFSSGIEIVGQLSGATVNATSEAFIISLDRMPLFAQGIIYNPGTSILDPFGPFASNQEEQVLITRSPFMQRVRLGSTLGTDHIAGEIIKIAGGCWDFIETQSRRVKIRINCEQKRLNRLPGNSYIHHKTFLESYLRMSVSPGDTELFIDDFITEGINPSFLIVDPDGKRSVSNGGEYIASVAAFDITTRKFILTVPIPANRSWNKNTKVVWYQAHTGSLISLTSATDTVLHAKCWVEDPIGPWIMDPGGADVSFFVKSSTFQKRELVTDLVFGISTTLSPDRPFDKIDLTLNDRLRVISESGLLGFVTISSIAADGTVSLTVPSGFTTSIYDEKTFLILESSSGGQYLELSRPIGQIFGALTDMIRFYGTSSLQPTYADHLADAGWPNSTPSGKWPGPYVFEPSREAVINEDGDGIALAYLDTTGIADPTKSDARIWMGVTTLSETFDPNTAKVIPPTPPAIFPLPGPIYEVDVTEGTFFPNTLLMNLWRNSPFNNIPGREKYPIRVVVGEEGGFSRDLLLYWGKQSYGTSEAKLYISGLQRVHLKGTRVAVYVERMPVIGTSGVFEETFGSANFKETNGDAILDHGTSIEESFEYDEIEIFEKNPGGNDRALLVFERGFVPKYSHDPTRTNDNVYGDLLGVKVARSDTKAIPRRDGYSFAFYLGGNVALMRLKALIELVKAAGIQVDLYDERDNLISL